MSLTDLDRRLLIAARTRGHSPGRDRAVAAFSRCGEHAACWLALGAAGALIDRGRRARWLRGARAVAIAYGANTIVKLIVRRPRPSLDGLPALTPTATGLSFPSAHATTAFTAARVYRGLLPAAPLYAGAVAFAASRAYLGVHYPSDVVAGAIVGTVAPWR